MDTQALSPENIEERIVWHSIRATYLFYALGALYIVAPVMAWLMLFIMVRRYWKIGYSHPSLTDGNIPTAIWLWILGMLVMLLALIIAHVDFDLGIGKSLLGDGLSGGPEQHAHGHAGFVNIFQGLIGCVGFGKYAGLNIIPGIGKGYLQGTL